VAEVIACRAWRGVARAGAPCRAGCDGRHSRDRKAGRKPVPLCECPAGEEIALQSDERRQRRRDEHLRAARAVALRPGSPDALGSIPDSEVNDTRITAVMKAYGMDYLGPALFGVWRQK
jgi:hypothetical protein